MKKIFLKLFILGGLLTGSSLIPSSREQKTEVPSFPVATLNQPKKSEQPLAKTVKEKENPIKQEKKASKKLTQVKEFLKTLPKIPKLNISKKMNQISIPSTQEIKKALDTIQKILSEEEQKGLYNLERQLMGPTSLLESTLFSVDDHNYVHSCPYDCFYFCTADALTIGYGLKIEFDKEKIAPEGIKALQSLTLLSNGRALTLDEKIQLAYNCVKRKKEYNKNNTPHLKKLRFEKQKEILFPNGAPTLSQENALQASQIEFSEKREKLLKRNPFLADSYFSQALGTDLAFQHGNTGVTSKSYYKNAKKGVLLSHISDGKNDRLKVRKLLCLLAYKYRQNRLKQKSEFMSKEEQNAFTLFAIQEYFSSFKEDILARNPYSILLMEKYMTLVMMQNKRSEQNRELNNAEINECVQKARTLVYDELFFSPTIQQLPRKLQPITMVDAVLTAHKQLNHSRKSTTLSLTPTIFMNQILTTTAKTKLIAYNKKYKTNLSLKKDAAIRHKIVNASSGKN